MNIYAIIESYYNIEDGSRTVALFTSHREAWRFIERTVREFPHHILNEVKFCASAGRDEQCDDLHYGIKQMAVYDGAEHAPRPDEAGYLLDMLSQPPMRIESAGVIKGGEVEWHDVPELDLADDVFAAPEGE